MSEKSDKLSRDTKLVHSGHKPSDYHGVVGTPVVRTSTIAYDDLAAYENPDTKYRYGRFVTPLSENFTDALTTLENGYNAVVAPSGLGAITSALLGFLNSGDHLLIVDTIYGPTRDFCDDVLIRMGVEVEYYPANIGADIANKVKPNTAVIYMESPGSATFDIQDVPAIVKVAKENDIITMLDNSWASGVLFRPIEHGVNLSILSCTKYINGHSDGMLGAVVADTEKTFNILNRSVRNLGVCAGSEETNLGIRGLKTISIRMKEAGERALKVAKWLEQHEHIQRVYHPALPSHPAHDIWKRDFDGCNGLLSILLKPASKQANKAFVDGLNIFVIGSSWGGYESLLQPQYLKKYRTAEVWEEEGFVARLQIGFEDTQDLIDDLDQALEKFGALL